MTGWVSAGVLLPFHSTTAPGVSVHADLDEQRPGGGADPMNNEWTVFATIFGKIQPPIAGWVDQTINALAGQIRLPLLATFVVFLAGYSLIRTLAPDAHSAVHHSSASSCAAPSLSTSQPAPRPTISSWRISRLPDYPLGSARR